MGFRHVLHIIFYNFSSGVLIFSFFRCNHDLLKAIEHFNINNSKQVPEPDSNTDTNDESTSAFKPVNNTTKSAKPYVIPHAGSFSFIPSNKTFGLYPFWPLFNPQFNPQPILPSPVLVQGFCECEQCKPEGWVPGMPKSEVYNKSNLRTS